MTKTLEEILPNKKEYAGTDGYEPEDGALSC